MYCHEQTACCLFLCQRHHRKGFRKSRRCDWCRFFEIQPNVPYTKADLNWMDKEARSTIEMSNPTSRPAIAVKCDNRKDYDTILSGFLSGGMPRQRSSIPFWKATT